MSLPSQLHRLTQNQDSVGITVSRIVAVKVLVFVIVLDVIVGSHDKIGAQKKPAKVPAPKEGMSDVGDE